MLLVSPGLGFIGLAAAILMAASRGWIGAHYPHHVLGGFIVGALVARLATWTVRRKLSTLAARLMDGPLLTTA
ncbi:phosphatase PAP2 family protein [Streptomyces sp. NPDC000971]|uniref:phosphatase PAP2 family protein n=1 Tax=Streptomyces TaxID=1883 RepID=UPI00331A2EDC